MVANRSRKSKRLVTGVNRKGLLTRWMGCTTVRVVLPQEKARDRAERSQLGKRRKRGQRKGKRRSRVGKTRRFVSERPLIPKPTGGSSIRQRKRALRERAWVMGVSAFIVATIIQPKSQQLMNAATYGEWRDVQWYRKQKRHWSSLVFRCELMKSIDLKATPVISFFDAVKMSERAREKPDHPGWVEVGFGNPEDPSDPWALSGRSDTSVGRSVPPPLPLVGRSLGQIAREAARGNEPPRLICRRCGFFHTPGTCLSRGRHSGRSTAPRSRGSGRRGGRFR